MGYIEVSNMTDAEKHKVVNHMMGKIPCGASSIHDDYIEIIKYGYQNTYCWDVVAFNFETNRARYGKNNGQIC